MHSHIECVCLCVPHNSFIVRRSSFECIDIDGVMRCIQIHYYRTRVCVLCMTRLPLPQLHLSMKTRM